MAWRVCLGFIFPCQDMRHDYLPLLAAVGGAVEAHFAVIESVDEHDPGALAQYGGRIEDLRPGIERLRPHGPDVVVYACTSGSFGCAVGPEKQAEEMAAEAGVPAINTTQAFGAAVRALGVQRVAVAGTYPAATVALFAAYLRRHGVAVVSQSALNLPTGDAVTELPAAEVFRFIASGDDPAAEAVLVPDTALTTTEHIAGLEAELGKPVLTANQVTVWYALRVAGVPARAPGFGRLLALSGGEGRHLSPPHVGPPKTYPCQPFLPSPNVGEGAG